MNSGKRFLAIANGQPWLVDAVAYEVTFEMKGNRDLGLVRDSAKGYVICAQVKHESQYVVVKQWKTHSIRT